MLVTMQNAKRFSQQAFLLQDDTELNCVSIVLNAAG